MTAEMPPSEQDHADVSALADGSLAPERRAAVHARLDESPALRELLDKQRRVVGLVSAAAVPAPPGVRDRVEALRGGEEVRRRTRRRPRRLPLIPLAGAVTAALVVIGVVLALPAGSPDVARAAELGALPAEGPPPPRYDGQPALALALDGVRFPRWEERFGWRASGARSDRIGGKRAVTIFYSRNGRRVGYTIVAAPALPEPSGARRFLRAGTSFRAFEQDGTTVVTWRRRGHTCVLVGTAVPEDQLAQLASWRGAGRFAY